MTIPTILTSYRLLLPGIQLCDACGLMNWIEEVSFWLSRLDDSGEMADSDRRRWVLVMAGSLQQKTSRPMGLCIGVLNGHISRTLSSGGLRP